MSWAAIKAGASIGRMPENVLVNERAIVIAGFVKEVDAVNQEVAPIQADIRRDVVVLTFRQSG